MTSRETCAPKQHAQANQAQQRLPFDFTERKVVWGLLAFLTAVAAALRFPFLNQQSLWYDETYTLSITKAKSLPAMWELIQKTESTPPLYYLIGWLFHADSATEMRTISAAALTLAVPIGYLALRRLVGTPPALAAASMLSVNPLLVSYGTNARSYGLFVLTGLLSIWGFSALLDRIKNEPQKRLPQAFGLWILGSTMCIWTHYFGVFLIAGEVIVLLITQRKSWRIIGGWTAALMLCNAPLLSMVLHQSSDKRAGFIEEIPLKVRVMQTIRQLAMGANVPQAWLEGSALVVVTLAVSAGVLWAVRSRSPGQWTLLLLISITTLIPLLITASGVVDRFYFRNIVVVLPLLAAFAAPAMLKAKGTLLGMYLALALTASVWVLSDWRYQQADWKHALAKISADSTDPVIAIPQIGAPVVERYLYTPAIPITDLSLKRVWLVISPTRKAGERAFSPDPLPALTGFHIEKRIQVHGFQIALLEAAQSTKIIPSEVKDAFLFLKKR